MVFSYFMACFVLLLRNAALLVGFLVRNRGWMVLCGNIMDISTLDTIRGLSVKFKE